MARNGARMAFGTRLTGRGARAGVQCGTVSPYKNTITRDTVTRDTHTISVEHETVIEEGARGPRRPGPPQKIDLRLKYVFRGHEAASLG